MVKWLINVKMCCKSVLYVDMSEPHWLSRVLEEITQHSMGSKKYPWHSCLKQTPSAIGWEMRVQLKKRTDLKDMFWEVNPFPLRQQQQQTSTHLFNLGCTNRSSKGSIEAAFESFSWRFRTFTLKYIHYNARRQCQV